MEKLYCQRLILRLPIPDDAYDLYEYGKDGQVTKFLTWDSYKGVKDAEEILKIFSVQDEKVPRFAIYHKEDKKVIGIIEGRIRQTNSKDRCAELGYVLNKNYWSKGYMTEACKEFIKYLFEKKNIHRIEAMADVRNIASQKVMEKCLMTYEGTLRELFFRKGQYVSFKIYSILQA